jgi:EAL domain-containing protein (putative c-di-GMP-specific phosphodiesterase class I)
VQPADFIQLLEKMDLMVQVGRWVLEDACQHAATWRSEGYELTVTVNVSTSQFDSPELVSHVENALARSGLDHRYLMIDVPEKALLGDLTAAAHQLRSLKQLGVRIAIDDFGVDDLPISTLAQLPVDTLKIHRSFMSGIVASTDNAARMRRLLEVGKSLGVEAVAKGIEEQEQLLHLQREHCHGGQGFLFAPSMDVDAVGQLLNTWAVREGVPVSEPGVVALPAFGG